MKKLSLVLMLVIASMATLMAQRTIQGTVSDENGEALIGATVLVQGTSTGAVTDIDGNYAITLPDGGTVLIFSYTGYASQEVTVGASNVVDINLEPSVEQLQEIIVTGYSEVEAKKLVSSVAVVDEKEISNVALTDVNQIIQGRAAGVLTTAGTGQPGAAIDIRVRGTGSITAGRSPLYVIDGVIVEQGNFTSVGGQGSDALANINPNDIANVTVLKDASALALYGSRGANGVVLITTKRGIAGKSQITAKVQYGLTSPTGATDFDVMTAEEVLEYERTILTNSGFDADQFRPTSLLDQTFDWVEAAFRTGQTTNLELQARGGNDKTKFFVSGGYFDQQGTLIESAFNRLSLRSNIDHRASDKLSFSLNVNGSYAQNLNATAGNRFASPLLGVFTNSPLNAYPFQEDGSYFTGAEAGWGGVFPDNFLYSLPLNSVNTNTLRVITKLQADYNILENLKFTQVANVDFLTTKENRFFDPTTNDGSDTDGQIDNYFNENISVTSQSLLKYFTTIGDKNNIDALAGFEYQEVDRENFLANGTGLASGQLQTLNSAANPQGVGGFRDEYAFVSVLGQLNYNYDDRYFFTSVIRRDGSSRFGANNRFATFGSVGASWLLSEENFLAGIDILSDLRLRASYGITANAAIGNFESLELYGFGNNYQDTPGSSPTQIANPDLTWETSNNMNIGLDFGLLKNRVSGTVEYYRREGVDLLLNVPVSRTSGFNTATRNIGRIENKGIEVTLSLAPVVASRPGGFTWNIDANFSANKNQILELPGGEDILNGSQVYSEGRPIRTFFMETWAGVNPADGTPLWDDVDGGTTGSFGAEPDQ
ncbi:MAG: SusC/RagA family TonB-linked outer membrane protein [Saprospiraceae bacterium]|nr:SusC/RagA family TonB-linked outer membrane protein [Saprospiraceae bacterium]